MIKRLVIAVSIIAIISFLFLSACQNSDPLNPNSSEDTIHLSLVILDSDTGRVEVFQGLFIEINYQIVDTFYNGPHEYYAGQYTIGSSKPEQLELSYGRQVSINGANELFLLDYDSLINLDMIWTSVYVSGGLGEGGPVGLITDYVAIKIEYEQQIKLGWIHTPNPGAIHRIALDTSARAKNLYAGKDYGLR